MRPSARPDRARLATLLGLVVWAGVATPRPRCPDTLLEVLRSAGTPRATEPELARARAELFEHAELHGQRAFAILLAGSLEEPSETRDPWGGGDVLSGPQRQLLFELLDADDPARLRARVLVRVDADAPYPARRAALEVLARVGQVEELEPAIALSAVGDPDGMPLAEELERMVGAVVSRDSRAPAAVRDLLETSGGDLRVHLIRGLGRSASPRGLEVLVRVLFDEDPHVGELLRAVGRIAAAGAFPLPEEALGTVERMLGSEEPAAVEAAADAAALIGDARFAERLVELVGAPAVRLRAAAAGALTRLAQHSIGADEELWRRWYERERTWFDTVWEARRLQLESGDTVDLVEALADVAQHSLHRDAVVPLVSPLLGYDDPVVRRLACACLAELRATRAVPALRETLEDADPGVATAARRALETLTAARPDPSDASTPGDPYFRETSR